MIVKSPNSDWSHEKGSAILIEKLIDNNHIDIDKDDVRMIQDIILGESEKPIYNNKSKF